jgi:hypothetical protein
MLTKPLPIVAASLRLLAIHLGDSGPSQSCAAPLNGRASRRHPLKSHHDPASDDIHPRSSPSSTHPNLFLPATSLHHLSSHVPTSHSPFVKLLPLTHTPLTSRPSIWGKTLSILPIPCVPTTFLRRAIPDHLALRATRLLLDTRPRSPHGRHPAA